MTTFATLDSPIDPGCGSGVLSVFPANNDRQDFRVILYGYEVLSSFSIQKPLINLVELPVVLPSELCALESQAGGVSKGQAWLTAVARGVWFIALWFALSGFHLADLPAAIIAVVAATWTSLRLLPPGEARPSALALGALALRFARQSLAAGLDVAWRALDPRLTLRPGFVTYETRLPEGPTRSAFLTLMSLLPGSLPAWQHEAGKITIHCLDVDQPVAEQMAEEEKLFVRALGVGTADD